MGGATFGSARGTLSRSRAVQRVLHILSHFCWSHGDVRVQRVSFPANLLWDSLSHVTDSCSRCRNSFNFDGLQHQWINRTGKNRLRERRNDAKSSKIIQWILIRKPDCSFCSWHLQAAFNSQLSTNMHYPKDPVMTAGAFILYFVL